MAKYNKSWGSVSTNFTKTTAPSSAARESKAAEDKYQKEMNQLRSMKDVAAFESKQAQTSASMATKAATYELNSLTKFSSTLNTFLNTTGKEMYAKSQAEDLQKHIDKYESSDLKDHEEWNRKQKELEEKVAGISENNAERAKLQEQLRKHNLTSPNDVDPAGLSGNEKLAYLSVKSKDTLDNVELNYDSWINDPNAEEVEVTWRPKIPVVNEETGATTYEYDRIPRASVNHPDGKKRLKQLFLEKTMEENPMGGLKNEWKTLILGGPLKKKLEGIQASETQQYNKDQARILDEASDQASFNFINGVEGYKYTYNPDITEAENAAAGLKHRQKLLNGVLQSKRFNFTKHSSGTYRKGVENWFDKSLQQITELTDGDKMEDGYENLKALLYNTPIPDGPNKGKSMADAFPDIIDKLDVSKKYATAYKDRNKRLDAQESAAIIESRGTIENQIKSDIESAKTDEAREAAINKGKETLANWQTTMSSKYSREAALVTIFATSEDPEFSAMLKTEADWKEKVDDLRKQFNGVVPLKEVGYMPNEVRENLENKYGVRFVRTIPGAENERQTEATKDSLKMLRRELRISEKGAGQKEVNGDSAVMDDLVNDMYHKLLQKYVIDDKVPWSDAATMVDDELTRLIRMGRTSESDSITDGPLKGTRNPFHINADQEGSAWGNNKDMQTHRSNRRMLLSYAEGQFRHADRKITAIKREREINPSKDYLFTPIQFDKTKGPGDEGYIRLDSLKHLGTVEGANPTRIMIHQASKLGITEMKSVRQFVGQQRDALIQETGGISSPIWSDPILVKAWGLPAREDWADAQEKAKLDKALKNPYYNLYSLGGLF